MTPSKENANPSNSSNIKITKPIFSTPESFNSVKVELQKVFSGITTVTSDLDISEHGLDLDVSRHDLDLDISRHNLDRDIPKHMQSIHGDSISMVIYADPPLENLTPVEHDQVEKQKQAPLENFNELLNLIMLIMLTLFNLKSSETVEKVTETENVNSPKTVPLEKTLNSVPKNNFGPSSKKTNNKKANEDKNAPSGNVHAASSTGARPKTDSRETIQITTEPVTGDPTNTEPPQKSNVPINSTGISYSDSVKGVTAPLQSAPSHKVNDTFESHKNRKQQSKKKSCNFSNIDSEESDCEWEEWDDGPIQLAPNPNHTFTVGKKSNHISSVPPVRQWPVETYSNSNYNHKGQSDAYQPQVVYPHEPPMTNRPNQPDRAQPRRPERIEKVSHKVSATGQYGEVELEQEATYEDDMEGLDLQPIRRR